MLFPLLGIIEKRNTKKGDKALKSQIAVAKEIVR
jgi:hypothetical protein